MSSPSVAPQANDIQASGSASPETKPEQVSLLGSALLRDYGKSLDPLHTNISEEEPRDTTIALSTATTRISDPTQKVGKALTSTWAPHVQPPKPLMSQHNQSPSKVIAPHRSILRTLASRSSQESLRQDKPTNELSSNAKVPFANRFTHSPCFFHQRFEDAVNVDRLLEEIAADTDGMSHSRLMQTATSVREISKQLQRRSIRRAVRSVMIVTKARDNKLVYLTRELAQWLLSTPRYGSNVGVAVYVDAKLRTSKRFDAASILTNPQYESMLRYWTPDLCFTSPDRFDLVLTLGGDGTVLYTSWLFQRIVPPILSFSLGSLGFLTNFAFTSYQSTLNQIMEGPGMRVNMRMRFTCTVYRAPHHGNRSTKRTSSGASIDIAGSIASSDVTLIEDSQFEVLNELVLDRGPSPYVSNLELYGDAHLLTIIQADGCIISTPTGSTAYSLSAGGPLTHPSIPGILLTPICPHTLSFRPMVLSDTLLLRLVVPRNSRSTAYASFDGKGRVELRRGDEVRVEAGRYPFPTVVGEGGTGGEWFESVRRALRWNTRGAVQGGMGTGAGRIAIDEEAEDQQAHAGTEIEEAEDGVEGEWDIDADPLEEGLGSAGIDSGIGASETGSSQISSSSPMRRAASFDLD